MMDRLRHLEFWRSRLPLGGHRLAERHERIGDVGMHHRCSRYVARSLGLAFF